MEEFVTEVHGLRAYVVVDSLLSGLAGGGLRFHPDVTLEELRALARTMSLKWAILGLPFGGCKLGIRGDPAVQEKAEVMRSFAEKAAGFMGERLFTGPDLGTTPADLSQFFEARGKDSYDVVAAQMSYAGIEVTPKEDYRRIMAALQGHITGRAVARAARKAWGRIGGALGGCKVSVQGYGSVGKVVTEELAHMGATMVGVADCQGFVYNPEGLNPRLLSGAEAGLINRLNLPEGTEQLSREAWSGVDADTLVPSAGSNAIPRTDLDDVKARLIVEAANNPMTEDVEAELHRRGITVLPDFLVNGGLAGAFGALLTRRWKHAGDVESEVIQQIVSTTDKMVLLALTSGRPVRDLALDAVTSRGS